MKKIGFTLAEVLITLTIIGVIAALTIPNLMQSYKKHQVEVKLKESYGIISNALKIAESEHGDLIYNIQNTTLDNWVNNYFLPYIKVYKDHKNYDTPYSNYLLKKFGQSRLPGCVKSIQGNIINSGYNCLWGARTLELNNGLVINVSKYADVIVFLVDIDGIKKGDAQYGVDIFTFAIWENLNNNRLNLGDIRYWSKNNLAKTCTIKDTTGTGELCAYSIFKNGWKIPDDYPIKKF